MMCPDNCAKTSGIRLSTSQKECEFGAFLNFTLLFHANPFHFSLAWSTLKNYTRTRTFDIPEHGFKFFSPPRKPIFRVLVGHFLFLVENLQPSNFAIRIEKEEESATVFRSGCHRPSFQTLFLPFRILSACPPFRSYWDIYVPVIVQKIPLGHM